MLTYLTLDPVQVGQSCVLDLALLEMRPLVAVAKLTQLSGYTDRTRPILGGFCKNRGLLQSTVLRTCDLVTSKNASLKHLEAMTSMLRCIEQTDKITPHKFPTLGQFQCGRILLK